LAENYRVSHHLGLSYFEYQATQNSNVFNP